MGVLAKKKYNSSSSKPHKELPRERVICIIIIILLICGILFGCSLEKKVSKAYEFAAATNPKFAKDSLNAIVIAHKVIKEKPPKIIPGKTIKVPVIKVVPDYNALHRLKDSLTADFKDRDSISRDECERQISEAINTTVDQMTWKFDHTPQPTVQCPPDTCPPDLKLQATLLEIQTSYGIQEKELIKAQSERDVYKSQNKSKMWWLIIFGAGFLTSVFFQIKGKLNLKSLTKL